MGRLRFKFHSPEKAYVQLVESTLLEKKQLRWMRHILRKDEAQLHKVILYSDLACARTSEDQKKLYKEQLNTLLKKSGLRPYTMEKY